MTPSKAPWTRHDRAVHDANDRLVAMCFGGTPGEAEANARLISAAPEMLGKIKHLEAEKAEMLEAMTKAEDMINRSVSGMAKYDVLDWTGLLVQMQSIIKKARGE